MKKITRLLTERKNYLEELTEKLKNSLACAPPGILKINSRRGGPQYYIRANKSDRNGTYVKKGETEKAAAIAQRDYEETVLMTAKTEIMSIDALLGLMENGTVENTYDKLILPRKELVIPATTSDEEYARIWQEGYYKRKGFSPGDPEFYSTSGERVRSKSEALLKDEFDHFSVPSRFEYPLKLWNGKIIHPDFTLLNVREREEFSWEHLGKADDAEYMNYNIGRLNDMILSGFVPGINLILTFETKSRPLNQKVVREYIQRFLL